MMDGVTGPQEEEPALVILGVGYVTDRLNLVWVLLTVGRISQELLLLVAVIVCLCAFTLYGPQLVQVVVVVLQGLASLVGRYALSHNSRFYFCSNWQPS